MHGRSQKSVSSPDGTVVVLAVSRAPADRVRLREILSQGNWKLYEASCCCEALALLHDQSVPVVLCERDHADGNWEDLLKAIVRLPAPPNLIVFFRLADESLWAEVLNLGGYDVLIKPFEPEEVLRVTFAAWSRWECEFVATTAKEAETADPPTLSTENVVTPCARTAGRKRPGQVGSDRRRVSALRTDEKLAAQ